MLMWKVWGSVAGLLERVRMVMLNLLEERRL